MGTRRKLSRNRETNEPAAKNHQLEEKPGAKPGWLADDELTRDWLQLVQQFRAECDASDRRRLVNEPPSGEATS
jgi:hypothetical protein